MILDKDFKPIESSSYSCSNGFDKYADLLKEMANTLDQLNIKVLEFHKEAAEG